MIDRSEAPDAAALVAWPARREWPAYLLGSRPAAVGHWRRGPIVAGFLSARHRLLFTKPTLESRNNRAAAWETS